MLNADASTDSRCAPSKANDFRWSPSLHLGVGKFSNASQVLE